MKIKAIELDPAMPSAVIVTVEGYDHARPVFLLADLTKAGKLSVDILKTKLLVWKANQDAIDTASVPAASLPDITVLRSLEGKDI